MAASRVGGSCKLASRRLISGFQSGIVALLWAFELRESFIWRRADWRNARPFPFQPTMQSALRFVRA
jgi:hypothetical protein